MSANTTYTIDFHGLKTGESYAYDFPIDDQFFGRWPEAEIEHGTGEAHVTVLKHASLMELTVNIDAEVELICDRCLDEFRCRIHFEGTPVVKISENIPEGERYSGDAHRETNNSDGDILWISPADDTLDLGQYLYESIMLSLPFQRVHPDIRNCSPDMLKRFRIVSESEFDELTHTNTADTPDTGNPFAVLAQIQDKQEENNK